MYLINTILTMRKSFILVFFFIALLCISNVSAQYSNASLNGPWFARNFEPDTYMIFDGNGNVNELGSYGGVTDSNVGTYSVTAGGYLSGTLLIDDQTYPFAGQFITSDSIIFADGIHSFSKIVNPGALSGTWTGTIVDEGTFLFTVNSSGQITDPSSMTGHLFTKDGKIVGFINNAGRDDCWKGMQLTGTYANSTISSTANSDCNDTYGALSLIHPILKTVNNTSGGLYTALTASERNTVYSLTVKGEMDARDFKTMRENMPFLAFIDLSEATIIAYSGTGGTQYIDTNYPENEIPAYVGFYQGSSRSKTSLISITLPSSTTSIGAVAFYYCNTLTSIIIPSSVTAIGYNAFQNCSGITGPLTIPSSVTSIGYSAFENCSGLTGKLTIPSSMTSIGSCAFKDCSGFTSIYAKAETPVDLNLSAEVFSGINTTTCILYVPAGSKSLYQTAEQWRDFTNIMEATVSKTINIATPGTLSSLLTDNEKNTLTTLTITGSMDARDFKTLRDDMPDLAVLDLSGANIAAYTGSEGTRFANVSYRANEIPKYVGFNSSTKLSKTTLTSITLPLSVTSIDSLAFGYCYGLESIYIPSSVSTIGYAAFYECESLKTINIPSSVNAIARLAFAYCYNLTSITIPSSVISIGYGAFYSSGLTNITLPNGVNTIGDFAFQDCSSLTTVAIPASLSDIGYCAFTFDNSLTSFNVASDNPYFSAHEGVLYDKSQKRLLCFPGGKGSGFKIPDGVTVIDTAAFEGSYVLTNVFIPSSVTTLLAEAFYWCPNLLSIEIPASVTSIGESAFNCSSLSAIYANATTPVDLSALDSVFNYVNKSSCILFVPVGTKTAYQAAKQWKDFVRIMEFSPVTDYDGNIYHAITIGNQSWLSENLKVTHYRNGDPIPKITDNNSWSSLITGAYCWYDNDSSTYENYYGKLYNWYAVNTGILCPTGWHVPTDDEWTTLTDYLSNNGYGYEGSGNDIAKSMAATSGWAIDNNPGTVGNDQASNNNSGFLVRPGGIRHNYGTFEGVGGTSYLWTHTEFDASNVWRRYIDYNLSVLNRNYGNKQNGFSVRCLSDFPVSQMNGNDYQKGMTLYPNPASDFITFESANWQDGKATLKVYNAFGTLIINEIINQSKKTVDVSNLSSGIYFVSFEAGNQTAKQKLVIKR